MSESEEFDFPAVAVATAPIAGPEAGPAPDAYPTPAMPESAPKRRIRGGTLFTAAVVLGVLGGVGTGYAVQSSRPPTPLPPLAATQPRYAPVGVYQGVAPSPLPTGQDDAAITDGDLTALLLPTPAGANTDNIGWLDQNIDAEQDADLCDDPVHCFETDLSEGVVAIADTGWQRSDGLIVEIRIFRMAPGKSDSARDWVGNDNGGNQLSLPSDIDAAGYEFRDKYGNNDDFAQAVHGDLVVSFWVTSATSVPDPAVINGIITQQMGRL